MDVVKVFWICVCLNFVELVELVSSSTKGASSMKEYCSFSAFNPQCSDGEVIVMDHALYGRMKIGQCIDRDFGNLGCQLDSLSHFDKKCSGKRSCSITIPVQDLAPRLSCLAKSFSPYLEASFHCQKVLKISSPCKSPKKIKASTDLMLSSLTSYSTSCGQQNTPYVIEGKPGQRLNISLIDFSAESTETLTDKKTCVTYGYILDTINDEVVTICGKCKRQSHVYTSSDHTIQIMLENSVLQDHSFLLDYTVLGCPDITPPEYGWTQKEGETVTVGCYASSDKWILTCADNAWIGYPGECMPVQSVTTEDRNVAVEIQHHGNQNSANIVDSNSQDLKITRNHVLIVTIGCFTLIFCSVAIITGVYCTKRYQSKARESKIYQPHLPYNDPTLGGTLIYKPSFTNATNQESMMMIPSYTLSMPRNDVIPPEVPERNASMKTSPLSNTLGTRDLLSEQQQEYLDNSNSVKYYVLENSGESTGIDNSQMYENTH